MLTIWTSFYKRRRVSLQRLNHQIMILSSDACCPFIFLKQTFWSMNLVDSISDSMESAEWNSEREKVVTVSPGNISQVRAGHCCWPVVTPPPTWPPPGDDFVIWAPLLGGRVSTPKRFLGLLSLLPAEKGRDKWTQAFGYRTSRATLSAGQHLNVSGDAPHWDILTMDKGLPF